jgi:hypothetical protein
MRELRKMQDSVRSEFDQVLHPDVSPEHTPEQPPSANGDGTESASQPQLEEPGHQTPPRALLPGADEPDDATDGFAGPSSFN